VLASEFEGAIVNDARVTEHCPYRAAPPRTRGEPCRSPGGTGPERTTRAPVACTPQVSDLVDLGNKRATRPLQLCDDDHARSVARQQGGTYEALGQNGSLGGGAASGSVF
jgi:hypothetical protein